MKCTGKYCKNANAKRCNGRGSFRGYSLWLCSHCGQIIQMKKA